jgi:hypothetical protein
VKALRGRDGLPKVNGGLMGNFNVENGITTAITLNPSNLQLTTYQLPQQLATNVYYNCQKTCQLP